MSESDGKARFLGLLHGSGSLTVSPSQMMASLLFDNFKAERVGAQVKARAARRFAFAQNDQAAGHEVRLDMRGAFNVAEMPADQAPADQAEGDAPLAWIIVEVGEQNWAFGLRVSTDQTVALSLNVPLAQGDTTSFAIQLILLCPNDALLTIDSIDLSLD